MFFSSIRKSYGNTCLRVFRCKERLRAVLRNHAPLVMFLGGMFLLNNGLSRLTVADGGYRGPTMVADPGGYALGTGGSPGAAEPSRGTAADLPSLYPVRNRLADSVAASSGGSSNPAAGGGGGGTFGTTVIREAYWEIVNLMKGSLGGLLTAVAGIGAVVAGAFGAYRAGFSLIVVAIGSFAINTFVRIYFGVIDPP